MYSGCSLADSYYLIGKSCLLQLAASVPAPLCTKCGQPTAVGWKERGSGIVLLWVSRRTVHYNFASVFLFCETSVLYVVSSIMIDLPAWKIFNRVWLLFPEMFNWSPSKKLGLSKEVSRRNAGWRCRTFQCSVVVWQQLWESVAAV